MSESKHTAGPWIVNPFVAQVDCGVFAQNGALLPVARMLWPTEERSEAETEANARLIAAAPALAETLVWLLGIVEEKPADADEQAPLACAAARSALKQAGII